MTRVIHLARKWTLGTQRGGGGYGQVFEAIDEDGNVAAVKLVAKKLGADREMLIARDVSGVKNVVEVIDSGEDGDAYVIVMPLADRSLRDELDGRGVPVPPGEAVSILTDVAEALAGVADRKVVHRDVKPGNVLLIGDTWQVSDFGIARYAEATTATVTFKGHGSDSYTAPERWRSETATNASDVYSFGVMAYELLAGRLPFGGPDYARQHQFETPAQLTGIPPKLASVVIECLDKAPEARPTAANILARLRSVLSPASPGAAALQSANRAFAERQVEASAKLAVARSEEDRRNRLLEAAARRLDTIAAALQDAVAEAAPRAASSTAGTATTGWARSLGSATLFVEAVLPANLANFGEWRPSFDIVAYSAIGVRIPPDTHGYEGRSHSLWYCDAKGPSGNNGLSQG